MVTVKHPNKGCFTYNLNSAVMSSVERLSSSWKLKLYGNQSFGTLKSVLCKEVYCIVSQSWGCTNGDFTVSSQISVGLRNTGLIEQKYSGSKDHICMYIHMQVARFRKAQCNNGWLKNMPWQMTNHLFK